MTKAEDAFHARAHARGAHTYAYVPEGIQQSTCRPTFYVSFMILGWAWKMTSRNSKTPRKRCWPT